MIKLDAADLHRIIRESIPIATGPGRPRTPRGAGGRVLYIRLSEDEWTAVYDAATAAREAITQWARRILLTQARVTT